MRVWRLFRKRFRSTAFTGAGGMYAASRWNHLEVPMVYTATSRALAALEFFVNLETDEAPDDLLIADLGSEWAASLRSLALQVPSAVVEGDWNVLLNPKHPRFAKVVLGAVKPFRFDERLFR